MPTSLNLRGFRLPEFADRQPVVELFFTEDDEYPAALRAAYDFLRRNGRYTNRTLSEILSQAEILDGHRAGAVPDTALYRLSFPSEYDEETEVKYGGMAGIAVVLTPENKLLLAVHRQRRRGKLGTLLMDAVNGRHRHFSAWVSGQNLDGQQFLLSYGLFPVSMNGMGAVCYSRHDGDPVEIPDGDEDPFLLDDVGDTYMRVASVGEALRQVDPLPRLSRTRSERETFRETY